MEKRRQQGRKGEERHFRIRNNENLGVLDQRFRSQRMSPFYGGFPRNRSLMGSPWQFPQTPRHESFPPMSPQSPFVGSIYASTSPAYHELHPYQLGTSAWDGGFHQNSLMMHLLLWQPFQTPMHDAFPKPMPTPLPAGQMGLIFGGPSPVQRSLIPAQLLNTASSLNSTFLQHSSRHSAPIPNFEDIYDFTELSRQVKSELLLNPVKPFVFLFTISVYPV